MEEFMITFNDVFGKQHKIPVDDIKSVKAEFNEHIGVLLEMNTGTIVLVKSHDFQSESAFNDVIVVDSPVYVLKRTLDLKISKNKNF